MILLSIICLCVVCAIILMLRPKALRAPSPHYHISIPYIPHIPPRWHLINDATFRLKYYKPTTTTDAIWILDTNDTNIHRILSSKELTQSDPYHRDLLSYLKDGFYLNNPLYVYIGDRVEPFRTPILCKSRPINDFQGSTLLLLNSDNHWRPVKEAKKYMNIPFASKIPKIVWRGMPTGAGFGNNIPPRTANRELLLKSYHDKYDFLDIGLTGLLSKTPEDIYGKYLKDRKTIEELSHYKYLLCVEGHDVATGLKWNLMSSSVIMMAAPTIASWYMEDFLEPFVHYIPLKDDFSDIAEKFEWAESHPHVCENIILSANAFIKSFDDINKEINLNQSIIKWYSDHVIYNVDVGIK